MTTYMVTISNNWQVEVLNSLVAPPMGPADQHNYAVNLVKGMYLDSSRFQSNRTGTANKVASLRESARIIKKSCFAP